MRYLPSAPVHTQQFGWHHDILKSVPKWKRVRNETPRTRPSWAESLEDPAIWIR